MSTAVNELVRDMRRVSNYYVLDGVLLARASLEALQRQGVEREAIDIAIRAIYGEALRKRAKKRATKT